MNTKQLAIGDAATVKINTSGMFTLDAADCANDHVIGHVAAVNADGTVTVQFTLDGLLEVLQKYPDLPVIAE